MSEYVTRCEVVSAEKYEDMEVKPTEEVIEIPDEAVGVNTTAITSTPVQMAVTYLVPKEATDE